MKTQHDILSAGFGSSLKNKIQFIFATSAPLLMLNKASVFDSQD